MLSNVAESLGQDFSPYLDAAMERALQSLSESETKAVGASEDGSVSLNSQEDSDAEANEDDRRLNLVTGGHMNAVVQSQGNDIVPIQHS